MSKLVSLEETKNVVDTSSKSFGFTNGCFDIVHPGHVAYLNEARSQVDSLIVGLNSDISIRSIKGKDRPIFDEFERITVLSSLEAIDYIVLFDEDTPINLIRALKPSILFKGGDYPLNEIVGYKFVLSYGGEVRSLSYIDVRSTSSIIDLLISSSFSK